MSNRFSANCVRCGGYVAPRTGVLSKRGNGWVVSCWPCEDPASANTPPDLSPSAVSNTVTFSSGQTFYRNRKGRCEDAPCCGCCTI